MKVKFIFNPFSGTFEAIDATSYLPLTGGSLNGNLTVNGTLSSTKGISVSGAPVIVTDTTISPSASAVKNIICLNESGYESLTVKDPLTLYIIT